MPRSDEAEIEATLRENNDEQEDGSRKRKSTPAQTSLGSNPTTSMKLCRTRRMDIVARDKPSAPTHEEITAGQPTTEDKPPSMSDMQLGAEGAHPSNPGRKSRGCVGNQAWTSDIGVYCTEGNGGFGAEDDRGSTEPEGSNSGWSEDDRRSDNTEAAAADKLPTRSTRR